MPGVAQRAAGLLLLACCLLPSALLSQSAGARLPAWTAGTLDIQQIDTGRGNAAFLILPDGTTMLVDAGNGGNPPPRGASSRRSKA